MNTDKKITNESEIEKKDDLRYITRAHENQCERLWRVIKMLFIGWIITIIIAVIAVVAVDIGWRMFFENCDINTYELEQGNAGVNVVGSGNEVKNGTESENQENPPEESASEKKN
jgi:hypothetical protein